MSAERNRAIVADRVLGQMSYAAIGRKHGLSHESVRRILLAAGVAGRLDHHETRRCAQCGRPFRALKVKATKACSAACAAKLGGRTNRGGRWSDYEMLTLTCDGCGETFRRSRRLQSIAQWRGTKGVFCSRHCANSRPRGRA